MVYGVYDYDFFTYENVVPNLECAKLVTYYNNHNQIATLTSQLNPAPYTQFIFRKEYNDGIFPKEIFSQNCVYGGRAFNPEKYIPFNDEIEDTIPNMHLYDKYIKYFGAKETQQKYINRILNCAHVRLAPDSEHIKPMAQLLKEISGTNGIFLHDYDLTAIDAYETVKELTLTRSYVSDPRRIRQLTFGNKYPIKMYSMEDMQKWSQLPFIPNAINIEYCGYMTDEAIYTIVNSNKKFMTQLYYNVGYACSDENDFLINYLPKIFKQSLFLRRHGVKILLIYDDRKIISHELQLFLELINCWLGCKWFENFMPGTQTLYSFCRTAKKKGYLLWNYRTISITIEDMRTVFQYIREKNYEVFKMFYELDAMVYDGTEFVSQWK